MRRNLIVKPKKLLRPILAKFAKIGDPTKALEALEMMTKIDQKKLIDAGAVDQVRADITKSFQTSWMKRITSQNAGRSAL
jgi:hypothetical protein